MKIALSEHDIQTLIISRLSWDGFYAERRNSGKIRSNDKYGKSRMINLAPVGTPDVEAFRLVECAAGGTPHVELYFIEVKRPGKKPTWHQEQKMIELARFGAKCIVATSVFELEEKLGLKHL
jgi:hypothetical protein